MVETVTIPTGALNNIPGVAGVDDVTFDIPQFDDIERIVDEAVPSGGELSSATQRGIEGALFNDLPGGRESTALLDDIAERIAEEVGDVGVDADALADTIATQLPEPDLDDIEVDVGGSLFDVEDDFIDLLAEALEQVGLDGELSLPAEEIQDALRVVLDEFAEEFQGSDIDEIGQEVETEVEGVLQSLPASRLLFEPEQFIDEQVDRVADGFVDEGARQGLESTVIGVAEQNAFLDPDDLSIDISGRRGGV